MAAKYNAGIDLGLLLIRLTLGGIFVAHGVAKLMGENTVQGLADLFATKGIPMPYPGAIAAIVTEIAGGAILILGLGALSRLAGLALAFTMLVAGYYFHREAFFAKDGGFELCLALGVMALAIAFAGPGRAGLLSGGGGGGKGKKKPG